MSKIKPDELQELFNQRNERAKELMDIFRNENPDNNPLVISGYKTRAVREANDEMLFQLLEKLDLLENG
ncbi:hypothetical protein EII36_07045 [Staphylococcus epidermidis]|uniref:Uncharacterized protein n=2 Tax=Rockefellervirus TaxID=2843445 RepID=A1BU90_9CAUD|nr:hypothetical protein [Staphylococcus epidermidis]YP_009302059.1 hypothetical protein BJD82_gp41 [Staphylococcus phage CNPx]YP_950703.1 hypothetical protein ph41 [Staphylococcus phage PH15]QQV93456.1 hypothetical protein [Staphylococcus virus vB_SepS_E72]ABI21757.1 hypothetical protein ph41 [Staphylococcus phage PH15]AMM44603.1 hypothetical protein [Staphylococcus phage CNPx]EGG72267.1 hypothetical protein SEVCU045_1508 [Staphylococcus epidermidis VCU045]ENL53820.1 hypothetical protein B46